MRFDPPFPINHLHEGERNRIRNGDLSPHERDMLAKGEDPWAKFRGPVPPQARPANPSTPPEQEDSSTETEPTREGQPTDDELLRFMSPKTRIWWDRPNLTPQERARIWQGNKRRWRTVQKTNAEKVYREPEKETRARVPRQGAMQELEGQVDRATKVMAEAAEIIRRKRMDESAPEPVMEKSQSPHSGTLRAAIALSISTFMWGVALNVLNQKYGTSIPDWTVLLGAYIAVGFWLYWVWHLEAIRRQRRLIYTYPRMTLLVMILGGCVVGGGASALLWWVIQHEQQAVQKLSPDSRQLPASSPAQIEPLVAEPTFTEASQGVRVVVGNWVRSFSSDEILSNGQVIWRSDFPVGITRKDGKILVSAALLNDLYEPENKLRRVQLINNVLTLEPPNWDRNFSEKALEIVNERGNPVFQVIYERPNQIRIKGKLVGDMAAVLLVTDKVLVNPPYKTIEDFALEPLFKYPSWKYAGEYADGDK